MTAIAKAIGAPSDDVALLLAAVEPALSFAIELPADPESLRVDPTPPEGMARSGRIRQRSRRRRSSSPSARPATTRSSTPTTGTGPEWCRCGSLIADVLHLEVSDRGRWVVNEASDERGRGLHLMNGLMDRVEVDAGPQGTRVLLERRRAAARLDSAAPLPN